MKKLSLNAESPASGDESDGVLFFHCMRMAHLYDPGNEAFRKPMLSLKGKLDEFLAEQGVLKVMFSEGQVYLNDTRLKVDSSIFEWVNELVNFFTEREIDRPADLPLLSPWPTPMTAISLNFLRARRRINK